jgi:hypothetical protein
MGLCRWSGSLINAISVAIVYQQSQGWYDDVDLTIISLFYIANAVLASGIACLPETEKFGNDIRPLLTSI